MKNNAERFQCFSPNLTSFLVLNGSIPTKMKLHPKTKRKCWYFIKDENLERLLIKWNEDKKEYLKEKSN